MIFDHGPKHAELTVRKRVVSGCWILDNMETVCKGCAGGMDGGAESKVPRKFREL